MRVAGGAVTRFEQRSEAIPPVKEFLKLEKYSRNWQ